MSEQRSLLRNIFDGPSASGSLGALLNEIGKGADRRDNSVEQNVPVALFFRHIEPDAISAQPLVGSNFARSIFDRIAVVFEAVPDHCSHQRPPTNVWLLFWDAFARHAAALSRSFGDLRAFVKRKSGKAPPYNPVVRVSVAGKNGNSCFADSFSTLCQLRQRSNHRNRA